MSATRRSLETSPSARASAKNQATAHGERGHRLWSGLVLAGLAAVALAEDPLPSSRGLLLERGSVPQIVTADRPDRVEAFAARELARCLGAIFGTQVEVRAEEQASASRAQIHVGRTKDAERAAPEAADLIEDSFILRTKGGHLFVTGSNPRGTLYGVYALLEDHLGVQWVEPGPEGEVLPRPARFDLTELNETQSPSLPHRCLRIRSGGEPVSKTILDYIEWQARQRMNYLYWHGEFPEEDPALLDAIKDRGFVLDNSSHSFEGLSPEGRIRLGAPEDQQRVASRIIEYLRQRPDIKFFGLWMGDGWGGHTDLSPQWCPLDAADQRFITREVDFRADTPKECVSNSYVDFVNRVQERVRAACPNVHLTLLAYNRSLLAPNKAKCAAGEQVHIAFRRSNSFGFGDPRSAWNSRQTRELLGWRKACAHVVLFEYYQTGNLGSAGRPYPRTIAQDLKYLKAVGAAGTASESLPELFRNLAPNYLTYAKCSWNVDANVERVLDGYYQGAYGPAAPAVRKLFDLWEETYNRGGDYFRYDWKVIVPLFTPGVLQRLKEAATEAKRLAASGSATHRRRADELGLVVEGLDAFMRYAATRDKAALRQVDQLNRTYPFIQLVTKNLGQADALHQKGY